MIEGGIETSGDFRSARLDGIAIGVLPRFWNCSDTFHDLIRNVSRKGNSPELQQFRDVIILKISIVIVIVTVNNVEHDIEIGRRCIPG